MVTAWLLHIMVSSCEATMTGPVIDLRELPGRRRSWVIGGVVDEGASDGGGQVTGDVVLTGDGHTGHALGQPIQIGGRRGLTILPALTDHRANTYPMRR